MCCAPLQTLDKHVISQQQLFADVMRELNLLKDLHCPLICNAHYAFQVRVAGAVGDAWRSAESQACCC